MSNADTPAALPPHPELPAYYRGDHGKAAFLRRIFDDAAGDYDRVEGVLALGSGRWYRRRALRRAGLHSGMRVLDVAAGTGLVAREALRLVGSTGRVVGVDPSVGMLRQAAAALPDLRAVLGLGEALPMADGQFDLVSMGYALRHLPDLRLAFAEFYRVLRPGGRLCILEITRPAGAVGRFLLGGYFKALLPVLSRLTATASPQTDTLWRYYWETIDHCVAPEVVMQSLRDAGFGDVRRIVSLGLFWQYTAIRPDGE